MTRETGTRVRRRRRADIIIEQVRGGKTLRFAVGDLTNCPRENERRRRRVSANTVKTTARTIIYLTDDGFPRFTRPRYSRISSSHIRALRISFRPNIAKNTTFRKHSFRLNTTRTSFTQPNLASRLYNIKTIGPLKTPRSSLLLSSARTSCFESSCQTATLDKRILLSHLVVPTILRRAGKSKFATLFLYDL